jgi:hypothetical protein
MEAKYQVYNLIILEERGSIQAIRNSIIRGFYKIVQTIKGVNSIFMPSSVLKELLSGIKIEQAKQTR